MKLLLDTHIWLWSMLEPGKLARRVVKELESARNELWLSPISVWELTMLCEKGKVTLRGGAEEWAAKALRAAPLKEAPFTHGVALETGRVRLAHRDPADQFLVATARVFELILVTADERLIESGQAEVLANR